MPPETNPQQSFMFMLLERIQALEKRESDRHIVRDVLNVRASDADYIRFAAKRHEIANEIVEAMKEGCQKIVVFANDLDNDARTSIVNDLRRREFIVTDTGRHLITIEWNTITGRHIVD